MAKIQAIAKVKIPPCTFMNIRRKGKFSQKLEKSNECENSECINEGANEITGNSNANSQQTIIQSNECLLNR